MGINVCLAGATGWAGSALARSMATAEGLSLVAAVSRKHAGRNLGDVLGEPGLACPVYATAAEALARPCDVFVEYTKPDSAKANILAALERGAHVVVGTSGLVDGDFAEIDAVARRKQRGVLACGNFALTVVLLQKFAEAATTRSTRRAEPRANSLPGLRRFGIPSPRSRWTRPWARAKPAARRCRAPRCIRFACPVT